MITKVQKILLLLSILALVIPSFISARSWNINYNKSSIRFVVDSRLGDVNGIFHKWQWIGKIDSNFSGSGKIIIDVNSIDTKNQKRDDHLRDPDFFEVKKYPDSTLTVHSIEQKGKYFYVVGNLNIKATTKPIKIKFKKSNVENDEPYFTAIFAISKKEYGLTYNSFFNPIEDEIIMKIRLSLK